MKKMIVIIFMFILLLIPNSEVLAINEVNIYFFYDDGCSICEQEKIYLEALKKRYPNMRVYFYEVSDANNNNLMVKAKNMYNLSTSGVPFTVIGDKAYLGFSQTKKALFQKTVYEYSKTAYENKLGKELGISYRKDLEGEVEEYKDNADYIIEETSGKTHTTSQNEPTFDKYKVSIYLIIAGIILAFIVCIIHLLEKRDRI